MNETLIEAQARHQIAERVARASAPRVAAQLSTQLPTQSRRHRMAQGLRRFADRLDS